MAVEEIAISAWLRAEFFLVRKNLAVRRVIFMLAQINGDYAVQRRLINMSFRKKIFQHESMKLRGILSKSLYLGKHKLLSIYPIKFLQKSIYYQSISNGISVMENQRLKRRLLRKNFNSSYSKRTFNENEIHLISDLLKINETPNWKGVSEECYSELSVYPISFSLPKMVLEKPQEKKLLVSEVKPTVPYSYSDSRKYLTQYETSCYALTFKKGGWDCFRHLEIMGSGCIPLMPDAGQIPKYTMTHYPKEFFVLMRNEMNSIRKPPAIVYEMLISWVSEYLTCEKMAAYVLSTANYHSEKIAFIDLDIDTRCDYLSVMTLIGLKQIIGKKVESLVKCDYIYEDYSGDTSALYGRGFGYTKILNPKLKDDENNIDVMNINELTEYSKTFQIIVINMRDRNIEIAKNLNVQGISARILYLWGSDTSMSKAKIKEIVNDFKGVHFCREIY